MTNSASRWALISLIATGLAALLLGGCGHGTCKQDVSGTSPCLDAAAGFVGGFTLGEQTQAPD